MTSTSSSVEKTERKDDGSIVQVEKTPEEVVLEDKDAELLAEDIRPSAEKRLVRLLDFRLLPTIVLIFILNYIDVSWSLHFQLQADIEMPYHQAHRSNCSPFERA